MADFYDEMREMAAELLAPTAQDGLGQGRIELVLIVTTPPANPWDVPTEDEEATPLNGAVSGVGAALVDGETILATDLQCIVAAADLAEAPAPPAVIRIDGVPKTIVAVHRIPEAGTVAAYKLILR